MFHTTTTHCIEFRAFSHCIEFRDGERWATTTSTMMTIVSIVACSLTYVQVLL